LVVIPKTAASNENSIVGIVKYALSGFVLECPHHGIIYRSRQYWYGNQDPESVVRTELKHIWSGQQNHVGTSHNLSRKIIDGVSYIGESLHSVSAKPTKLAMQWMSDQVAPTYWIPNSDIISCYKCDKPFVELLEKKHHCRGCGRGFCDKCSSKRMVISWWSPTDKVRVCDDCFVKKDIPEPVIATNVNNSGQSIKKTFSFNSDKSYNGCGSGHGCGSNNDISSFNNNMVPINQSNDVTARKVTETVQETIGYIGYATKLPFDVLKESARPSYWKPDADCINCFICHKEFDDLLPLHHCRSCGNGICNRCSPHLRPVPSRGWDTPVRVCNNCVSNVTNDN
jgi:zinc finger FYVE domain-containing protein 1